jgi:hypothetical protein
MITCMALMVAALHLITGEEYGGPLPGVVNGYLIDVLLPMVLFLLMGLIENRLIGSILFRAWAIFAFSCIVEISQYLNFPIFGSTFDPFDILGYAVGVSMGILHELFVFPRLIRD